MSGFLSSVKVYKKYRFDIKTGLNPFHFPAAKGEGELTLPFTALMKKDSMEKFQTGGDFTD